MRLPSPTDVEVGVAAALSSQVVVYLIIESTCVTSRRAVSWTESSYTVGVNWGRPRFRKPRLAPHSPARKRFCSGVGGGGGVGIDSVTARVESGGGSGCCAPSEVAATQSNTVRQRIKWSSM